MIARFLASVSVLSMIGIIFAADPPAGTDVFGLTKVHSVQLTIAAKVYAEMDRPPNANPFGPPVGAVGRPAINPADAGAGNFGFEFTNVHADLRIDGQTISDIGLRLLRPEVRADLDPAIATKLSPLTRQDHAHVLETNRTTSDARFLRHIAFDRIDPRG